MAKIKCSECEWGQSVNMPRHGKAGSHRSSDFVQQGYFCNHLHRSIRQPGLFYGESAPRLCPKRQDRKFYSK